MTEDEAAALNIQPEDRLDYVRFDDAKTNYSRLERARWFVKKTVSLDNGDGLVPADEVGVFVPWTPPGALDGITIRELGWCSTSSRAGSSTTTGSRTGSTTPSRRRRPTRPLGRERAGQRTRMHRTAAQNLIKDWLKNGVLEVTEYLDPFKRRGRQGVRVVPEKRPDVRRNMTEWRLRQSILE